MTMNPRLSIPLFLSLAASVPAQVGKPMPALEVDRIFNFDAMKLKRLDQLRGSAILVDYWQTW